MIRTPGDKLAIDLPADVFDLPPAQRARLARYLELPSAAAIDAVTDSEIRRLDAHRWRLLAASARAVMAPVERIRGRCFELRGCDAPLEATESFAHRLAAAGADSIIIAGLTLGSRIDDLVAAHLREDEVFEAFVLKQWSATMAEQARVGVTRALAVWAKGQGLAPLPFDGPGYNGWPLESLASMLGALDVTPASGAPLSIRVTGPGMLWPINSLVLACGVVPHPAAGVCDEPLFRCGSCLLPRCRYRMMPPAGGGVRAGRSNGETEWMEQVR